MQEQLAHRHAAPERDAADSADWHELAVANPTFVLERLGSECADLQGLRELTVNGRDAIAAQGEDSRGRLVWDMDWVRFDSSGGRLRKLSVIDTGTDMTPEQMHYYINQLAVSGREQSSTGNFGVGAKVAAGSRNSAGLEYRSWHEGNGSLVCFKGHRDGRWGLGPQHWENGHADFWRPLSEADKPWLLRGQAHGTQVVLLGHHERDDTTRAPESVAEARRQWITRYLNGRFLRLPGADRTSRSRGPWPSRARPAATDPRRATPRRAACPCSGRNGAQRRDRALVGARRRSSRPARRSRAVGLDRSRRGGVRP
jgi:hypothetical protein